MNIVIATSKRKVNGAVVYARQLLPRLAARGHRVWLAASPDSWIAARTAGEVPLLPTEFRRWPPGEVRRVADFCRRERIDLFHSHSTRASHFGAILRAVHDIPSVAHMHSSRLEAHVWFHSLLVAVSRHTLACHRRWGGGLGGRGVVLPNFVDADRWKPAGGLDRLRALLGLPQATPVLFVAGQICPTKGQDIAVKCLAIVRRRHPSAVLVLAGQGRPRRHHQGEGVHLLGYREDLPDLLPHATLLLVPSRRESFGLAAVEAMACGVPVIAADAGGVAEVVAGGAGTLVPVNDPAALAEAAIALVSDPAAAARQAALGMRIARERYSPEPHVESLERHYSLAAGDRTAGPVVEGTATAIRSALRDRETGS